MTKLKILRPKEMEKFLFYLGFKNVRQKGSHAFYSHPDGRNTTIPFHPGELPRPIIRIILKQININIEEFNKIIENEL